MQAGWPGWFASKVRPGSTSSAPLLHECICTEQRHLRKYRAFSLFHVFLGLKGKLGYTRGQSLWTILCHRCPGGQAWFCSDIPALGWVPGLVGLLHASHCRYIPGFVLLRGLRPLNSHCLCPNASPSQKARVYLTSGLRSSEVALLLWDSQFIRRCGEGVDEAGCWLASTAPTSPLTRFCRAGALWWTVRFPWDPVCFYF